MKKRQRVACCALILRQAQDEVERFQRVDDLIPLLAASLPEVEKES
jgi:hypothetical protein